MLATVVHPEIPARSEIRQALARVVGSARFRACPRLTSFLHFIVEAELAGQGARLKGYTIGVEAFGRPDSFDPQIDPIVRVEATRLRRALDAYYAGEGIHGAIVIAVPRGHYVPVFRVRATALPGLWSRARSTLQRFLAAEGMGLLPPAPIATQSQISHGRQDQQAEGAPAARARRSRAGRDRGDAAHDRGDPRGL